jgi:Tfp pilus assembly protein PilV
MARRFLRLLDERTIPVYPNVGFFMLSPRTANAASFRAFTLAEVMMATVVTLVAVVGLVQAVTIGAEMLDVSRKQTVAMQLIRNEIEGVHLQSWTTVNNALTTGGPFSLTINSAGTGLTATATSAARKAFALTNYSTVTTDDNVSLMGVAKDFTCSLTVTTVKANLLQLTYTVTWTGGNRRKDYSRSSTTYYGKYGLNLYYRR